MKEFFHGWRRKAGLVTLLMACGVLGLWMRSRLCRDEVVIQCGGFREFVFSTTSTSLEFDYRVEAKQSNPRLSKSQWTAAEPALGEWILFPSMIWGPYHGFDSNGKPEWGTLFIVEIPYLTSVASLTLLSAYLILWNPRKRREHCAGR